jgi:prephenate dehydrogenase
MRVAVLGVGLIGGSIGLAARERLGCEVVGWGPNRPTLERAEELGAVDRSADSIAAACEGAEIVFCAAPVSILPELAREALAASGPGTVVTDAGSTKRGIVAELGGDERFLGGHPLAGAETAGVASARADLFEGARWYLTPTERTGTAVQGRLRETIAGLGARPREIDAAAHDRLMATVSHLPHVLADVLVGLGAAELARDSELLPDAGPSFRDATRVAGSNPTVWGDIFAANREAVAAAIDDAIVRLDEARALIRGGDAGAIAAWHAAAGSLLDAVDSGARKRPDEA